VIRVVFPPDGLVGELVAVLVDEPLGETVGEPLGELVTGGRLRVGVLLGALRVGVDEGSFRADFDCLGVAAADETPAGWLAAGLEAAGAGLGAGAADARGVLPMVPAGAEDAECLTAAGGESLWPALRLTASTPPPARATTATAAMAAIARLLRQVKAAGAARCTGKPSAPKEFDRLMTRSR
jgi:hypothetical protein